MGPSLFYLTQYPIPNFDRGQKQIPAFSKLVPCHDFSYCHDADPPSDILYFLLMLLSVSLPGLSQPLNTI